MTTLVNYDQLEYIYQIHRIFTVFYIIIRVQVITEHHEKTAAVLD